ncbi:family 78 glycoside hydrolase catalytic domain [Mucilaginibacter sp. ZT4R22]|uniref:alpha-L-rhamnosidase n=1 Tax=Mucilaginibacter pankratovii TaxID=2772110 RepID=A0ABR7WTA1_9SPHI|nr:alpha-L-rhamnosidase [Mucilaginibacter pankratovii]MBD1365418.1 family 78 glycoside hydrolase catalytic domain [Mucilaginibacter pankratovii]
MKPLKALLILLNLFAFPFLCYSQAPSVRLINLKTEYTSRPLGIDVSKPRFSWQMASALPGCYQTAFQIVVTDEGGKTVWDSGKKQESGSLNIRYAGKPLKARTRYSWLVNVWDQQESKHSNKSWFETGLMDPDGQLSAWSGAKWIGGSDDDLPLYPQYLPVFRLSFSIQLDEASGSTHAGFIYGANDSRLLDKNKNYYGIQNKKDSTYILLELDIAPLGSGGSAQLNIYRVGYKPGDRRDKPFKSFTIPASLIGNNNKYEKHTVFLSSVMGTTQIYLDAENKQHLVGSVGLNPLGQGGDYIAFPVLAQIGFSVPNGQAAYYSNIQIRNFRSPANVLYSGYTSQVKVKGTAVQTITLIDPARNAMPMLRMVFPAVKKTIAKARLYVTSRGIYDVYLNGRRIGSDYFNPGLTQYNKTHLYQSFDVTSLVVPGKNAMGAVLGEGWWSGGSTYSGDFWNFFGDRQSLLAKLVITYADGKEETVVTDPQKWTYFNQGPVVCGSFFQGEVYDALKEAGIQGWSKASFDDSKWHRAVEVGLAGHISLDPKNKASGIPAVDDYSELKLIGQFGETVRKVKELTAKAVEEVRPGVFVYDLGQNMAGAPYISLSGMPAGKKITVRFAEVKYPDLPEYKSNIGMIMLENIRAAMAQEIYITRGGKEIISPRFTYHGFRYIEITGIDRALPLTAVKGDVLSSVHRFSASYETSNTAVNKLWQNITWSTLANFMSIPTDCPQRNERLGWSGDISVFSGTATYLAEVPQFLRRHMLAMRDVQRPDGRFSDVAPLGGGFGDTLWGSAGIAVAWESYQQYGDIDLLAEHYDAMKGYIKFLISQIDPKTHVLDDKNREHWASLGDWLSPEYNKTEKTLLWEAYFINDLQQMAKIAAALGKKEDESWLLNLSLERTAFFNATYINHQTGETAFRDKVVDTQTSYAVPLAFGIIDGQEKDRSVSHLAAAVKRKNINDQGKLLPSYSLMTGFIGTAWISAALSDNGLAELAYRQLQQTSYPSWLYPVEQGATTIWERLNSYTHTEGFGGNNNMNSFNHYSFGAVGAWMCSRSLGIQRDQTTPGFKHFILAPEPDPTKKMTYARGFYESLYGKIESSWRLDNKNYYYHFHVPANTSATLYLHTNEGDDSADADKPLVKGVGAQYRGQQKGKFIFELSPGDYDFQLKN